MKPVVLALAFMTSAGVAMAATNGQNTDPRPLPKLTIEEIFRVSDIVIVSGGAKFATPLAPDVVLVRKNDDGTFTRACVDTEAAAKAFFAGAAKGENRPAKGK